MITLADICGGPNGCTVGDGIAVIGIGIAVAAIAVAIAMYNMMK